MQTYEPLYRVIAQGASVLGSFDLVARLCLFQNRDIADDRVGSSSGGAQALSCCRIQAATALLRAQNSPEAMKLRANGMPSHVSADFALLKDHTTRAREGILFRQEQQPVPFCVRNEARYSPLVW
jgi:hypothetical protein